MNGSNDKSQDTKPFSESTLKEFIENHSNAKLQEILGGTKQEWKVTELGDGNLNLVYIITGPKGSLCVKQSLPYIRKFPDFPLSKSRIYFEYHALDNIQKCCPNYTPKLFSYDESESAMVMEYLTPHVILRKGLMKGTKYPHLSEHLSTALAQYLFFTSDFGISAAKKTSLTEQFADNFFMCKLTEDVIFSDPYLENGFFPNNVSDQCKKAHQVLLRDTELKLAVCILKGKFLSNSEALIHGDLHTGSIMVTNEETKIIDAEFGFCGPMGFDIGLLIANLFLSYFSKVADQESYCEYLLQTIKEIWIKFKQKFTVLWQKRNDKILQEGKERKTEGDVYPAGMLNSEQGASIFFPTLFKDTIGYAGVEMIRRCVGIAHVEDLEEIKDPETKAFCEYACIRFARYLICECDNLTQMLEFAPRAKISATLCNQMDTLLMPSALVLVSQYSSEKQKMQSKLSRNIGINKSSAFSLACISDLMSRFASFKTDDELLHRILLHSQDDNADHFQTLVQKEVTQKISKHWHFEKMEAIQESSQFNLLKQLTTTLGSLRSRGYGTVIFVTIDCPELTISSVKKALQTAAKGSAYISPTNNGGYAFIGVPKHAPLSIFEGVPWGKSSTCLSQFSAFQHSKIKPLFGDTFTEFNTLDDLRNLNGRISENEKKEGSALVNFFKKSQIVPKKVN